MPQYHVYIKDTDDRIEREVPLERPDDFAALETAIQLIGGDQLELWNRDRRLAKFSRHDRDDARRRRCALHLSTAPRLALAV